MSDMGKIARVEILVDGRWVQVDDLRLFLSIGEEDSTSRPSSEQPSGDSGQPGDSSEKGPDATRSIDDRGLCHSEFFCVTRWRCEQRGKCELPPL